MIESSPSPGPVTESIPWPAASGSKGTTGCGLVIPDDEGD